MSDDEFLRDLRVEINGVDFTSILRSFRIDILPPPTSILPTDIRMPKQIMGEAKMDLSADEWANLSEHLVFSDEPGEP